MTEPQVAEEQPRFLVQCLLPTAFQDERIADALGEWIERAIGEDHRVTVDHLIGALANGDYQALLGRDWNALVALAITSVIQYPTVKALVVEWAAADHGSFLVEMLPALEQHAIRLGCEEVHADRRLTRDFREIRRGLYVARVGDE